MISAKNAKYIKLGEKGRLEQVCFESGALRLGYHEVPDEAAQNLESLVKFCKAHEGLKNKAVDHARQVYDFYSAGEETIWFTFANGFLYWCKAQTGLEILGYNSQADGAQGSRFRKTVDGWHNTNINGEELRVAELNGNLTKVSGYRGTICNISEELFDYLLRKINAQELPQIEQAKLAQAQIINSIEAMMKLLHWKDFELLVELVFAQSGWQRLSSSGGTQKTIDIEMILPSTGERAFVQVKSKTNNVQLQEYVDEFENRDEKYMFYVYHSLSQKLKMPANQGVKLIGPERFSAMVLNAGLFDWLLKKVG